ncbi:MAG TPA: septum formation inhibitor Maf [Deltaproteobacteria bacterium]|nr:septum formation inhibitor Maf [Deltaproteobacteria bacterium]
MKSSFILASASPRRQQLLRDIGLQFDVIPGDVNEDFLNDELPVDYVSRMSREKSDAIAQKVPDAWVLGADTIVIIDGEVLGKPLTREDARNMLIKLSGREHCVITGFTIVKKSAHTTMTNVVESRVVFKTIEADELEWYIDSPEPYDKAGAYAVQGMAGYFVKEIHGSYTNVVGLPLTEVVTALKEVGAVMF